MEMLQLVLLIIFILATPYGYYKDNKNIMLVGSLALFTGFFGIDFALGFVEGFEGIQAA